MIVCQCNCITDRDIAAAACELVASDYSKLPTPGYVYHQLGKRMRCASCLPHAAEIIANAIDRCSECQVACVCIGRAAVANDDAREEGNHERQTGST